MGIAAAGNRNEGERQAMEVAEEARESWERPSFCEKLFGGDFRFDLIFPFPEQSDADRKEGDEFIQKVMNFLYENLNPEDVERDKKIPPQVIDGLAKLGAFGVKIAKEYGGLGLSQTNYNRVIAIVGSYCASTATWLTAHQSIGAPQPLKLFGTKEQKERYLPRLAKGAVSAFALTEVGVGSDPAKMTTRAEPTPDGEHWIINGEKLWCTNGTAAEIIVVMAATPSVKLPNGKEKKQITAFIVERSMPGFEVVHRCDFMGLKGIENGLLRFTNVKVPKENIIWGVGKGLKLALVTLNTGRLTLPGGCAAIDKMCLQVMREWSQERVQWGRSIGEHEATAEKILLAAGASYASDAVASLCTGLVDRGSNDIRIEASLAKLFSTGMSWKVIDNTMQVRGGRGYETSESLRARGEADFPVEKMMRDFRINTIVEGTSSIQRLFVSREALDRHLKVAGDLFNPSISGGQKFLTLLKVSLFYAWWYPQQWLPTLPWRFSWAGGWEGQHLRYINCAAKKLARSFFHQMIVHGPKLEKKQLTLGQLVNIGSNLFVMACVMSRYLTRKKEGKVNAHEGELVKMINERAIAYNNRLFREHRKSDSRIVELSKQIMQGELSWIETDISLTSAARSRTNSVKNPSYERTSEAQI